MINKKAAATPDALKRDSLSNYLEGYYFVTLNTRGESPILSSVEGTIYEAGAWRNRKLEKDAFHLFNGKGRAMRGDARAFSWAYPFTPWK